MPTVKVKAPGKINLFLRVGPLEEDGYHQVATVYHALDLYDELEFENAEQLVLEFSGGNADWGGITPGPSNLAMKAARLLQKYYGTEKGAHIRITKNIPVAGGMGGGSADAAATLVGLNALWNLRLSTNALINIGAELGADVPFAILGGTAVGAGRGELLSPALGRGSFNWVIVPSDAGGLSTPDVYARLDEIRSASRTDISPYDNVPQVAPEVLQAVRVGDPDALASLLTNDLEEAAIDFMPQLQDMIELGIEAGALAGMVSGSGPTLVFLCRDAEGADDLAARFTELGHQAIALRGPAHGTRVV